MRNGFSGATSARSGTISGALLAFISSVALLTVLVALLLFTPDTGSSSLREPLVVYCAAGIKVPVEAVAYAYEQTYGVPVRLQYGGSQTLLANIELSNQGDLYLPADDNYHDLARKKGLIAETLPVATMTPVLAVAKGNPKAVRTLEDLLQPGLRLAQANPDAAAIGKMTRAALSQSGHWEAVKRQTRVFKPTVNDVANDIKVGTVDAGIVWDVTVRQYPDLDMICVPQLQDKLAHISFGVLRTSVQPTAALRFARYLAARDRGLLEFEKAGFQTITGDVWSEQPELRLLAGAMLRPAIEETIDAFRQREGVRVTTVYNGCGILVAQMRGGERPDAYFACDKSFMAQVHDLFLDATDISMNQLVILVPKGNPHHVRTLEDLGKPGLRIGVGHEKQCALGVLTQQTLQQAGYYGAVMKNVAVQTPTGDMLVNQLRTGSLDAVVAYISNATTAADELEAMAIDVPCALAVQPFAVGKESPHKYLTARLLNAIRSTESRERFESSGFHWQEATR